MRVLFSVLLLLPIVTFAQQKKARDWKPAVVTDITYDDDEKVVPHSHMVKREGCQGGIGCYDKVEDEPRHIPEKFATYHFETADTVYLAKMRVQ